VNCHPFHSLSRSLSHACSLSISLRESYASVCMCQKGIDCQWRDSEACLHVGNLLCMP
jgi:hypothetical protein